MAEVKRTYPKYFMKETLTRAAKSCFTCAQGSILLASDAYHVYCEKHKKDMDRFSICDDYED